MVEHSYHNREARVSAYDCRGCSSHSADRVIPDPGRLPVEQRQGCTSTKRSIIFSRLALMQPQGYATNAPLQLACVYTRAPHLPKQRPKGSKINLSSSPLRSHPKQRSILVNKPNEYGCTTGRSSVAQLICSVYDGTAI